MLPFFSNAGYITTVKFPTLIQQYQALKPVYHLQFYLSFPIAFYLIQS